MKKVMKKMLVVLTSVAVAFSFLMNTHAAVVTVPKDLENHLFKAYQLFTGTQKDNDDALGDIEWGKGIQGDALLNALIQDQTIGVSFKDCKSALDVAEVLEDSKDYPNIANTFAKFAYRYKVGNGIPLTTGTNELEKGYYLIVDESEMTGDFAYNAALLQVTDSITISVKTDKPFVEKKVQEDDKYHQDGGYGQGYNDVADYHMGESVPFKLIGTIPNMTYYDTYKYIFHDTLSNGLTLNKDSLKVYVANDKAGTDKIEVTGWFLNVNGQSFSVSFDNLKIVRNIQDYKYVLVEYNAVLNQEAEVGLPGNPNEVYLEYSNQPDQSGNGDNHSTGETPKDKVIVFTYELDVMKADSQDDKIKLEGAEFKLHDQDGRWVIVEDGKVVGWSHDEEKGSSLVSNEDGFFQVIGLDDGIYYLKETKAPAGYNLLKDEIKVTIEASTIHGQEWMSGVPSDALKDFDTGIVEITVLNQIGSRLPETGGIGNYVYYIGGFLLIISASYYFMKKRKGNA